MIGLFAIDITSSFGTDPVTPETNLTQNARRPLQEKFSFVRELVDRTRRVPELKMIQEWGDQNGIRIWLGGGSATGIAAYFSEEHHTAPRDFISFPYEYYEIYRSTQDLDLVIDGNEEQAVLFENFLKSNFSYLQGSKQLWEVRLMRDSRGTGTGKKDALLGSDFLDQNSDSYSTGVLELTTPPKEESPVRDLFEWDAKNPQYLRDLLERKVSFYRNAAHGTTWRAQQGYNPEIISVIRTFTKAFQYDAKIRKECISDLKAVIKEFNEDTKLSEDAIRYIKNNGLKLFQHARDVERAWNELEHYGLRKKLIGFAKKNNLPELEILLNREPLRSYPLGTLPLIQAKDIKIPNYIASEKTAAELEINIVSHETKDFLAYENITMSRKQKPNFFQSRNGYPGENAKLGDGTYTRRGLEGAAGTKLTVRSKVNPDAIEGRDFYISGDYVIFRNAAAITRIPEEHKVTNFIEFLRFISTQKITPTDQGVIRKLELKFTFTKALLNESEKKEILTEIQNEIKTSLLEPKNQPPPLLSYIVSKNWKGFEFAESEIKTLVAENVISTRCWSFIESMIELDLLDATIIAKLTQENPPVSFIDLLAKKNPELILEENWKNQYLLPWVKLNLSNQEMYSLFPKMKNRGYSNLALPLFNRFQHDLLHKIFLPRLVSQNLNFNLEWNFVYEAFHFTLSNPFNSNADFDLLKTVSNLFLEGKIEKNKFRSDFQNINNSFQYFRSGTLECFFSNSNRSKENYLEVLKKFKNIFTFLVREVPSQWPSSGLNSFSGAPFYFLDDFIRLMALNPHLENDWFKELHTAIARLASAHTPNLFIYSVLGIGTKPLSPNEWSVFFRGEHAMLYFQSLLTYLKSPEANNNYLQGGIVHFLAHVDSPYFKDFFLAAYRSNLLTISASSQGPEILMIEEKMKQAGLDTIFKQHNFLFFENPTGKSLFTYRWGMNEKKCEELLKKVP